jgi:hypothetical protein
VDRAVHATASAQGVVRRVHDRIGGDRGDVCGGKLDLHPG